MATKAQLQERIVYLETELAAAHAAIAERDPPIESAYRSGDAISVERLIVPPQMLAKARVSCVGNRHSDNPARRAVESERTLLNAMDSRSNYPDAFNIQFSRMRRWLPRIEEAFRQPRAFVAVGIGHLTGAQGLVGLFEADGFVLERIVQEAR